MGTGRGSPVMAGEHAGGPPVQPFAGLPRAEANAAWRLRGVAAGDRGCSRVAPRSAGGDQARARRQGAGRVA
eukprot:1875070-Pleurochrysis_carterae.AAC.1